MHSAYHGPVQDLHTLAHRLTGIKVKFVFRKNLGLWLLIASVASTVLSAWAPAAMANNKATAATPRKPKTPTGPPFGERADAMALADTLAQRHALPTPWVRKQLSQAREISSLPKLVLPPPVGVPKNWAAYHDRFVEPRRIEAGRAFWETHRTALARAEAQFGVPAAMIVGIIGVETYYGRHMGNYRVIDALTTLGLNFPAEHPRAAERQKFFQDELGHLLVQMRKSPKMTFSGSYAGAMGWPQFMPSSWARFAVDFDGDGRIDLINSPVDAIGSVARYFQAFGWKTGMPTHYAVNLDSADLQKDVLLAPDILPSFSAARFQELGAQLGPEAQAHVGPLALVELQNGEQPASYVAGTENFYVVTRYNWSSYYAMAVIKLGEAIKAAMPN
jgi:membrane-bound lytic murein transglycosylase B